MVKILMMSAKMATPGLLKIKVFWNKGYDVIISVHDVTNKILSVTQIICRCGHERSYHNLSFMRIWPGKPQCGKRVKTKSQKVFGGKVGESFCTPFWMGLTLIFLKYILAMVTVWHVWTRWIFQRQTCIVCLPMYSKIQ